MTVYNYDPTGKLIQSIVYDSDLNLNKSGSYILYDPETSKVRMAFNSFDYTSPSGTIDDDTYCSYTYSSTTGNIEQLRTSGTSITGTIDPDYDNLGRSKSRTLDYNIGGNDAFYNKLTYSYYSNSGYTSGRISQVSSEIRKGSNTSVLSTSTYKYTYDSNGNITEIRDANDVIQYRYTYDSLGQLIREDNRPLDRSVEYEYDRAGNIQYIYTYNGFTTGSLSGDFDDSAEFNYGDSTWKDLVTEADGSYITYDAIGNPVTIGQTSLTWRGRQLTNYALSPTKNVSYTYNADGIRTSKTVVDGSTTTRHEYTLSGSQIVKETVFTGSTESYTLVYLYDEYGSPIGFRYRTPSYSAGVFDGYFFEKNIQGDIVGIWNQNGTKVVTYTYDAWGNVTVSGTGATGIGAKNPFRYRGYYFDTETGLYYLQTRYYNPSWGRFISADKYLNANADILGFNMFAYCGNEPVNQADPSGDASVKDWISDNIIKPVKAFASDLSEDFSKVNYFNTDELSVYDSHYFAFYKGTLVLRHSSDFLTSWSIGGMIFLNRNNDKIKDDKWKTNLLKHEFGHILQERDLGVEKYITDVAIPSVIINLISRKSKIIDKNYHNFAWEYDADIRGGASFNHSSWAPVMSDIYWWLKQ